MKAIGIFVLVTCIFGNHVMAAAEIDFKVTVISPHRNQHLYTIQNEGTVADLKTKICKEWFRGTQNDHVPLTPEELKFYVVATTGIIVDGKEIKDKKRVSSALKQAAPGSKLKWLCNNDGEIFYRSLEVQKILREAPDVDEG